MQIKKTGLLLFCAFAPLVFPGELRAYGPVGHMRVVIESWNQVFAPDLDGETILNKDLAFAALAGAVSSDIGYVKSNARDFTDSVHYVRSGDFVAALIQNARNRRNKKLLAFALGFETHYWADRFGHYAGTNKLVAQIRRAPFERFTYEEDPCTHTWVETQLSFFDLRDAPAVAFTSFVDAIASMHGDADAFLVAAYALLRDTAEQIFPGAKLAFGAMDLFKFLRFVAASISTIDEIGGKTFGAGVWHGVRSASSQRVVDDAEKQEDEASGLTRLREDLIHRLPLDRAETHRIYTNSLHDVASHMGSSKGAPPNYNLDTNLPSRAGQYQCADAAFYQAEQRMPFSSGGKAADPNTVEFERVYKQYKDSGIATRRLFSEPLGDQPESVLFHNPDLDEAVTDNLFDIAPSASAGAPVSVVSMAKCPASAVLQFGVGSQSFKLDWPKRVLCIPENSRVLDALYAHFVAGVLLGSAGSSNPVDAETRKIAALDRVRPSYREALDRTRLDENVGRYATSVCPNCTHGLNYAP